MGDVPGAVRLEARVLQAIENHDDGINEGELAGKLGLQREELAGVLNNLKKYGAIESRVVGNSVTWYSLQFNAHKKVLIVEDDPNINNLVKVSLGGGYSIRQAHEGRDAMKQILEFRPDLIVLDLMLPGIDGLEICRTVKKDPELKNTIIIIVSATDAVKNRFKGLKYGADYYIKKPFEPKQLRSLTSIFLRKKGKRFDPLVDLPDERRLSAEIDRVVSTEDFEVTNLHLKNLEEYGQEYGEEDAKTIVRLVSQLLQDKVSEWDSRRGFVGYLGEGEFVVAGGRNEASMVVNDVAREFDAVLNFIYQGKGLIDFGLEDVFGNKPQNRMHIEHSLVPLDRIRSKREEIIGQRAAGVRTGGGKEEPGAYTYEQLRELIGGSNMEVAITRGPEGEMRVKLAPKGKEKNEGKK
ncbi:MAG: response regulator [Candidatus Burarchaeum sp.]|nr:response regulator [Candidatus Burarchaeum sp.]MDO8339982.1 response regulator [Candidatus Burarchaeum sp.]